MDALLFRTRVTALWLAVAIAATASFLLYMYMPGALEELLVGEMEGETVTDANLFLLAAFVVIPLVMAGVALLVSDRVNRYANLIAGAAYGLFAVFAVIGHVLEDGFNVHVLMAALAGVAAFLIAGLSLARPRTPTA
ncbi:MAG: DUF6326 family protein [Acidimicrobiia bacterium]